MMHGSCGQLDEEVVCMINDVCSKSFPYPSSTAAHSNNSGYSKYRRSDDELNGLKETVRMRGWTVSAH